jgi:hypothetical protein
MSERKRLIRFGTRAMDSLQYEGVTVEMALAENFEGALLKAYSKMLPKT